MMPQNEIILFYKNLDLPENVPFLKEIKPNFYIFKKFYYFKFPTNNIENKDILKIFREIVEKNKNKNGILILNYTNIPEKFKIFINSYEHYGKYLFPLGCVFPPFDYHEKNGYYYEIKVTPLLSNLKLGFYLQLLYLNKFGAEKKVYRECRSLVEEILLY